MFNFVYRKYKNNIKFTKWVKKETKKKKWRLILIKWIAYKRV